MPRVHCPTCDTPFEVPDEAVGRKATCTACKARFRLTTPDLPKAKPFVPKAVLADPPPDERSPFDFSDDRPSRPSRSGGGQPAGKYCDECGERIRLRAEICPACGVRQPEREYRPPYRKGGAGRDGVKVPLLVSAISNILVGLFWLSMCFGAVFAVPMFVLSVFEFLLWSQADDLPERRFADKAKTMGIFEIIVGLANTPTLICGIIVLINAGKLGRRPDCRFND